MYAVVWTVVVLYILMIVRLKVAGSLRMFIIDEIHRVNKERITRCCTTDSLDSLILVNYDDMPSFTSSVFDLTMWTKKQALRKLFPSTADNAVRTSA